MEDGINGIRVTIKTNEKTKKKTEKTEESKSKWMEQ